MKQIAPDVYISTTYPYVNVSCVVGADGVVALDAPTLPEDTLDWRQQIETQTAKPIVYTALTDAHPHRMLCAGLLGAPIVATQAAYEAAIERTHGFWRNFTRRLSRQHPEQEHALKEIEPVLPEILFGHVLTLHKAGTDVTIQCIHGAAPGSAWVDLRAQGVLFVGDTLVVGVPPVMADTPSTAAWLDTLSQLRRPHYRDIAFVPGRGPASDQSATEPLSEYIRVARRRMRSLHREQDDQEQAKDPTGFAPELLSLFSLSEDERHRLRRRVRNGLKRVFVELTPEDEESA